MSKNSQQNVALAAAIRSLGQADVRPVWGVAKDALASGLTIEEAARKAVGATGPAMVKEPAVVYAVPRTAKPARKAKARAKKLDKRVRRPVITEFAGAKKVTLERPGEPTLTASLAFTFPRAVLTGPKKGVAMTHDCALALFDGTAFSSPGKRFTLSTDAMERLRSGKGTRVWHNDKAYVAKPVA